MDNRNPVEFDSRLQSVPLGPLNACPPESIVAFVDAANARTDAIRAAGDGKLVEFVPSNGWVVYNALEHIRNNALARGDLFCEWGSGIGVATCLAGALGFAAHGVEIQSPLVVHARELASAFAIPAQFYAGSYQPAGSYSGVYHAPPVRAALGFDPFAVDVVFAYPWPAEEHVVFGLFAALAPVRSLLLTYHGAASVRLCQKKTA